MTTTIHHIKAYIVFLILSLLLIGILVYLYTPFNAAKYLKSQTITISAEASIKPEVIITEEFDPATIESKRMRYTALLLRYQKDLSELESGGNASSLEVREKIANTRKKIENVQKIILELVVQ